MALTIDLEAGLRPSPPPEQGTPDGRFVFKELLGQGAEGSVYLAIPTRRKLQQQQPQQHQQQQGLESRIRQQRSSAIKVVSGGRAYERCRASRGLWPKLVHPNVVFPRESWWDDANSRCFVQMELCDTDMLDLVCETGALGDARGSTFAGHLASALAHLHGQGIAHQDVKLENIFVSRQGVAKLGDVGSVVRIAPSPIQQEEEEEEAGSRAEKKSKAGGSSIRGNDDLYVDASITSSSFVGSVMYAPPEAIRRGSSSSSSSSGWRITGATISHSQQQQQQQQQREQESGRRDPFAADMWALGVSIWSAMAGCHPWELACVDRSKEFRTFVRQGAAASLPVAFSPGLKSLLSRLLSLDPRERPTAAEVLASRWVSPPPTTPPTTRSSRDGRPGASNTIPSWPCALSPSDGEQVVSPPPQQQQQWQQRQPAPITPTAADADQDPAAFPHPNGGGDGGAKIAATNTITAATIVGGSGGLGRPLEQERQLLLLNVSEAVAAATAASPTAAVVAAHAGRTEGPVPAAAVAAAEIVSSSATTLTNIEPSPIRSGRRRSKKRKTPEAEEEEEEEEQRGLAAVAKATLRENNNKKGGFVLENHEEQKEELLSFSPEMNALGSVLLTGGDGGDGDDNGGGGGGGERPAKKIVRVSPSPLALPAVMMATAAEKIERQGCGCNNTDVARRPSSPSALFSGLGTRQSLLSFFSQRPLPPATTRTTCGSALHTNTLPVPTSGRAAAASRNVWDAGEGSASTGGAFATISFAPGERRV